MPFNQRIHHACPLVRVDSLANDYPCGRLLSSQQTFPFRYMYFPLATINTLEVFDSDGVDGVVGTNGIGSIDIVDSVDSVGILSVTVIFLRE